MKILFVSTAVQVSVSDVSRGYRTALERSGHDIADYILSSRFDYHKRALPPEIAADQAKLSQFASENIVVEAMLHRADLVVIISGLNVHPVALWLLGQVNIPIVVVFTESTYDDEYQAKWLDLSSENGKADVMACTNDKTSAIKYGWTYLPPSFDPAFHHPVEPVDEEKCDVVMVATGWAERQSFLEAVNWTGINLRLLGVWPGLDKSPDSPLQRFYSPLVVDNTRIAPVYCSAKVCLNFHRLSKDAHTPGPRLYETAACGAFQLSDPRPGITEVFGDSVPVFNSPVQLEQQIRYFIDPAHDEERRNRADVSKDLVRAETFDTRVASMLTALQDRRQQPVTK